MLEPALSDNLLLRGAVGSHADEQVTMRDFVQRHSIVRTVWGNSDVILLIFAGSAAEFALNRAVDWLFFTNQIPRDPIGRLFSTVRYAQEIVFVDEATAQRTLDGISAIHHAVERQRGQKIPEWAFRDVLYMLVDYSERAYELLYRPLTVAERQEMFAGSGGSARGCISRICPKPTRHTRQTAGTTSTATWLSAVIPTSFIASIADI
ncbi:MAG TPA: oxygenase MpaB family protein [Blastocatellia bacterium]|nr:oxygenase MpaB family protein [Blastocatellia bacterium]